MTGKAPDLCLTLLTTRGTYLPVGQAWRADEHTWRVWVWTRPGAGRLGVFLPPGMRGALPARLSLHAQDGTRIGSGAYVPGLRAVMLQVWSWPVMCGGGCWLRLRSGDAPSGWSQTPAATGNVRRPAQAEQRGHPP